MSNKFTVDKDGKNFTETNGAVRDGYIEVPTRPEHGWQVWDFNNQKWKPLTDEQKKILLGEMVED